jgi:hypothetical protein
MTAVGGGDSTEAILFDPDDRNPPTETSARAIIPSRPARQTI